MSGFHYVKSYLISCNLYIVFIC